MEASRMRRFWDARAREDALHFVDSREPYKDGDLDRFWAHGERDLDTLLTTLDVTVRQGDLVLDLGCGVGRLTRVLAKRAAHVIALDVSPEMLRGAVSHVVFQHIPDAKITLGYVEELGRVLKPGAWAAFGLSTDPKVHQPPPPEERGTSRREMLRGLVGRQPRGTQAPEWLGSAVPLEALGAVATSAGLVLEDIDGSGTQFTLVRATRARD
jgi:hypothetical protein